MEKTCRLCKSKNVKIGYYGFIRDGKVGSKTPEKVNIFQCENCGVMWHDAKRDLAEYYEDDEYRESVDGALNVEEFYEIYDHATLDKLMYTGTSCYRNKTVADIGCGGGAFLDFIYGVAKSIIAIEPYKVYRDVLRKKGYYTYAYASDACGDFFEEVDIITSFDVIEHVEDPIGFLAEAYKLLKKGGRAIIGTPTDMPLMRSLVGKVFEEGLLFSTQHIWILNESSLRYAAEQAGFEKISIKYYQRYGIDNMITWLRDKEAKGHVREEIIPDVMNAMWKGVLADSRLADYIVIYLEK